MKWNNFEFHSPEFLWLLILIPLLAFWSFYSRKKDSAKLKMSSTKGFKIQGSILPKLKPLLYLLRLLALTCLIIALARPRNVAVSKKNKNKSRY